MGVILMSSLLGVAALIVRASASGDANITLWVLPSPVLVGDTVVLVCQYQADDHNRTTTFFKDGREIGTYTSPRPGPVTNRTIENVTEQDEGTYTCASGDGKLRSPDVWLSVGLGPGSGKWVLVSCAVLLLPAVPLTAWLLHRYRFQMLGARSCWPVFKAELPALPATRQDVTEVQWELSWMEMSSLMDKHLYSGT